jgi:hypothetical protein
MPVSWFYTEDEDLARLQEIFYHLSPPVRRPLLTQAENLLAAHPTGANEEQTGTPEASSPSN